MKSSPNISVCKIQYSFNKSK